MQRRLFDAPVSSKPGRRGASKSRVVVKKGDRLVLQLINQRQRQILLHSYLYYHLDSPRITDQLFDKWSLELVALRKDNPTEYSQSVFLKEFEGFDGSTGMDLPYVNDFNIRIGSRIDSIIRKTESF